MIAVLQAIQVLNALLAVGVNALPVAQEVGKLLEQVQSEGRDITQEEWDNITSQADRADVRLALAIQDAEGA